MAVKIHEIVSQMEILAPPSLALSWDNVGLLVGDENWTTKKVLLALDATDDVIAEAIEMDCNLILTHHPLIFKPLNRVNSQTSSGKKLLKLIQHKIAVYSAHTNLDLTPGGVDDLFAAAVGLTAVESLPPSDEGKSVGRVGTLSSPVTLDEFIHQLKHNLEIDFVTVAGKEIGMVKTVATVCGSGMRYAKLAAEKGADVFVTGDLKYHDGQTAEELGLTILDVTHFNAEKSILSVLQQFLQNHFSNLEVLCSTHSSNLFKQR